MGNNRENRTVNKAEKERRQMEPGRENTGFGSLSRNDSASN